MVDAAAFFVIADWFGLGLALWWLGRRRLGLAGVLAGLVVEAEH